MKCNTILFIFIIIAIEVSSELLKSNYLNCNKYEDLLKRKKRQYGEIIGYYPYSYYGYINYQPSYRTYFYTPYGYPYHL
uniref:Uncharacterized protein n=1 Tax=Strongyloides stercoralis TaxID=6248 RepID=A0A0K0DWK4_STRER